MDFHFCLMVSALFCFVHTFPQTSILRVPRIDFSSPQEINNLEPSATPGIQSRSYSSISNGNYVEATVEEVQNILKTNPDLPRLTRGEILDLLENITREDMEKLRSLNSHRNGKAILLVMPYSPKRNGETMEDLYTKRPVTQLIDTDNSSGEDKNEIKLRKPVSTNRNEIFRRGSVKADFTTSTLPSTEDPHPSSTSTFIVSTTQKNVSLRSRTRPSRTRPPTTSKPPTTTRPLRRRRITTTTTVPTTRFQNHKYPDKQTDKFMPENAMRSTRPFTYRISRRTTTNKPDLSFAESYVDNVYVKYDAPQDKSHETIGKISNQNYVHPSYQKVVTNKGEEKLVPDAFFKPLPSSTLNQMKSSSLSYEINSPHLKSDEIKNESIGISREELFKPLQDVIITTGNSTDSQQTKSSLKLSPEDYIIPEDLKYVIDDLELKSTLKKNNVLKDAMKSATVFPRTTTSTTTELPITPMPEFKEVADNLSPEMKSLLMTFGLIPSKEEKKEKSGLQGGYYPEKAEDHPESYTGFKPLPEDGEPDKDMDALLASFGLGRSARKGRKVKKEVKKRQMIDISVIPNSMKDIVENLGLSEIPNFVDQVDQNDLHIPTEIMQRTEKNSESHKTYQIESDLERNIMRKSDEFSNEIENKPSNTEERNINAYIFSHTEENDTKIMEHNNNEINSTEPGNSEFLVFAESEINSTEADLMTENPQTTKDKLTSVVFNPTDQKIVEDDKQQLDKLMELVKALKAINGSASEEDFKNIDLDTLKHFTEVLNTSQRLTFGEQLSMSKDEQEMHSTTTEFVTLIIPSETQNEIQSESQVLEETPGGFQVEEMDTESPAPKKLQSGPYYLIDWNSFLEVDDTKGRRVNLRFQPTVGDPNRFYAINNN